MARPGKGDVINCQYYTWRLFARNGVWYADGRGNQDKLGKHSLGTREKTTALENLRQQDLVKSAKQGRDLRPTATPSAALSIEDGWNIFLDHAARPEVTGGASRRTLARYRAVRDKHVGFCKQRGINSWQQVDETAVLAYGRHLEDHGYAPRTLYLELTTIQSLLKLLIKQKRLSDEQRFELRLRRPQGSDTYCYTVAEVTAMITHCQGHPDLRWLAVVLESLTLTGLRISELASLRRDDLKLDEQGQPAFLSLTDERASAKRSVEEQRRTKGRRGRVVPVHPRLTALLEQLPQAKDGLIFHGPQGGKLKPDTVRKIFVREVLTPLSSQFPGVRGQVGFADGRLHSFRHFFLSRAFAEGATEAENKTWVGHRDSRVVELYRHLSDHDSRQRLARLQLLGEQPAADGPSQDSVDSSESTAMKNGRPTGRNPRAKKKP